MSPTESGTGPAPADAAAVADQPEPDAADDAVVAGAPELIANSVGEYARIWIRRVRNGESGALPIILGLVAIVIALFARRGLWGLVDDHLHVRLFPVGYWLRLDGEGRRGGAGSSPKRRGRGDRRAAPPG